MTNNETDKPTFKQVAINITQVMLILGLFMVFLILLVVGGINLWRWLT